MDRHTLKENRIHGLPAYPLSVYEVDLPGHQSSVDCHWHDEWEWMLVTAGRGLFQIGAHTYEATAGQTLFIRSGELHAVYRIDEEPCRFTAIVFDAELLAGSRFDVIQERYLDPLLKKRLEPPPLLAGDEPWERETRELLDRVLRLNDDRQDGYELDTKALLLMAAGRLSLHAKAPLTSGRPDGDHAKTERLKTALNAIHEHYASKLTLGWLSSEAGMSEGHFCRFFKSMVRKSPTEYINGYRVRIAAKLLENEDRNVSEVALDVGFENPSYFIRVFKQHQGCTPAAYKKMIAGQA
ncbi:AraC family transcriptional regulator [Paenibacillus rhizovicinus]|uniref:AraC family transcriptional regulator n=1 Tax=Paenibacillus rhizovicinus TaxID=2704463 RepID=A0A6C0PBA3_9BACL|nr:AraC family transcriptional regulator [Paenibacillus rhizovicinus]QHW33862.1 AraC family transcriptional regulator [Paenibacillus rhizovicinus]